MDPVIEWILGSGGTLGATGLLAIFVLLLLTGRMLPISWVRRLIDQERQRGDDWKAAFERSESARALQDGQVNELLEHSRTANRVMESVERIALSQHGAPPRRTDG